MKKQTKHIAFLISFGLILIILFFSTIHVYVNFRIKTGRIPNTSQFWKEYYYVNYTDSFIEGSSTKIYEYDSLLGWRIKPNYSTTTFCNDKTFTSDSLGIRKNGHQSLASKKTILFIGDSFVEGCEVSDFNTLPAFIEQLDSSYHVINAGVGGYGFDQIYLYMKRLLHVFSPNIIVLGYVNADIDRVHLSFRDYYKPYFTLDKDSLMLHNEHIEDSKTFKNNYTSPNRLGLFFEVSKHNNIHQKNVHLSSKLIEAMDAYARSKNFPFYIYFLPTTTDFINSESNLNQVRLFGKVTNSFNKNQIFSASDYIIDRKELIPKREGHWDSTGNYFLAQYFVDSVLPNIITK
ncbi:MAG: SGNH/GDSL hydrolase family protein [Chitinophagales bacterium]|nr:SGNH/GDSL hydrolase family protein [Chitinophagales bacterium]